MIAGNELRIGNWVNTVTGYQWIDYLGVDPTLSDGDKSDYEQLEPIPLTLEILEKAGFKKYGNSFKLFNFYLYYYHFTKHFAFEISYKDADRNDGCRIKYVHQLQNLYFALTGQELEINL